MNTNFINIIKRIIAEQGEAILADPQRVKGYVHDYAANESKPERLAFGRCIEYGAYTELKNAPNTAARQMVKATVAQKVQNNTGLDITICNGALDVLEAALFGIASAPPQYQQAPQTVYLQTPTQSYQQQAQYHPQPQYQMQGGQQQYQPPPPSSANNKDKGVAILLYVFLGGFGAHYFYVSNVGRGLLCLLYNIGLGILTAFFPLVVLIAWLLIWIVGLVQLCDWQTWLSKNSK
jgi:TM2 domain-containing membrane protein YozV